MKDKLRNKKGITLIALVITIIVLLILARVSITMISSQDGILNKATGAKDAQKKATDEEAVKLAVQVAMMNENGVIEYDKIGDYLSGATGDKDAKVIKYKGNNYLISEDGTSKQVVWYITTVEKNSKIEYVVTNGKEETEKVEIPLGATINYNPYTTVDKTKIDLKITAEKEKTGDEDDQIFQIEDNEKQKLTWQVLGTDGDGNILILPTTNIKVTDGTKYQKLNLVGQKGVQYGVEVINKVCSIYGYGKGAKFARSIQITDIDKLTKYDKTTWETNEIHGYNHQVTYTKENGQIYYEWNKEKKEGKPKKLAYLKDNEWKMLEEGDNPLILRSTSYNYGLEKYKEKLAGAYSLLTKDTDNGNSYWLGSSNIYTKEGYIDFAIRIVTGFYADSCGLYISDGSVRSFSFGLRPAVSLAPNVILEEENGVWNIK